MSARYEIPAAKLAALLWKRGWMRQERLDEAKQASPEQLVSALRAYQKFHGLKIDGWAGPITERSLNQPRICALPDRIQVRGGICRWPMKQITWSITGGLPGISNAELRAAYEEAWGYWAEVSDIEPIHTPNARAAHVVMGSGRIDRSGGTLAWSEMPCEVDESSQLEQRYDNREPWGIAEAPGPGQIDLVRVAAHEIGHALGIPHLAAGNLLAPTYDPNVRRPKAGDIEEIVRRYGRNEHEPPPPDEEAELTIRIQGTIAGLEIPGYRVSRLEQP